MKSKIVMILLSLVAGAEACRYTVREIGFAEVGPGPYKLYIPVDSDFPGEDLARAQMTVQAALWDANIIAQVMYRSDLDTLSSLRGYEIPQKNVALVSARGGMHVQPFSLTAQQYKQELWDILEWACISPLREKINETLVNAYCVVLFIPGLDQSANAAAASSIHAALAEIEKVMPAMPKPVSRPPMLVEMTAGQVEHEQLLLWGLETAQHMERRPRAAVLYGRCRRLGPVLENEQLTGQNLLNLLALVGADCECGLDRSWILGTTVPARWGAALQQAVAKELGFDVENPAVRMEMEQILAVSTTAANARETDVLAGYREGLSVLMAPSAEEDQARGRDGEVNAGSMRRIFLISFAGIGLLLVVPAALVYWKLKKKKRHD